MDVRHHQTEAEREALAREETCWTFCSPAYDLALEARGLNSAYVSANVAAQTYEEAERLQLNPTRPYRVLVANDNGWSGKPHSIEQEACCHLAAITHALTALEEQHHG